MSTYYSTNVPSPSASESEDAQISASAWSLTKAKFVVFLMLTVMKWSLSSSGKPEQVKWSCWALGLCYPQTAHRLRDDGVGSLQTIVYMLEL